jgi:hypothetical protein
MERIERLRRMAKEALHEYHAAITGGGEPAYPQWAEDIMAVCEQAETAAADRLHQPLRAPALREPTATSADAIRRRVMPASQA